MILTSIRRSVWILHLLTMQRYIVDSKVQNQSLERLLVRLNKLLKPYPMDYQNLPTYLMCFK